MLSIVTIVLNDPIGLERTIQSALALREKLGSARFEHIVVDSSPRAHLDVRDRYPHCFWIEQEPRGIYAALNEGTEKCSGRYIIHLNSADIIWKTSLLIECLQSLESADYVLSFSPLAFFKGEQLQSINKPHPELKKNLLGINLIGHPGVILRRELIQRLGMFDTQFKIAGDYDLWVRIANQGGHFLFFPHPYIAFQIGGVSGTNDVLMLGETWRANRKLRMSTRDAIYSNWRFGYQLYRAQIIVPLLKKLRIYNFIHNMRLKRRSRHR